LLIRPKTFEVKDVKTSWQKTDSWCYGI